MNRGQKIVGSVLGNNGKFYSQVALLRRIISDYRLKEHTEIINRKWEDNDFVMDSMEQISTIFLRSCENKKSGKYDIITDIKRFQQKMLMAIIYTPGISK